MEKRLEDVQKQKESEAAEMQVKIESKLQRAEELRSQKLEDLKEKLRKQVEFR